MSCTPRVAGVCVASSFIAHSKASRLATAKMSSESEYRDDIWCGLVHFGQLVSNLLSRYRWVCGVTDG